MMIRHSRSRNPNLVGKNPQAIAGVWFNAETSLTDLVSYTYVGGRGFCAGTFDEAPLLVGERTNKTNARWRGSQLIVLDVDDAPGVTLAALRALPIIGQAAAIIPSSSYTPERLKAHILFVLSHVVDNAERYIEVGRHLAEQFPFAVDLSTVKNPSQLAYGTVYREPAMAAHRRALDDGLVYINDTPPLINVPAILAARIASGAYKPNATAQPVSRPTQTEDVETLNRRVAAHAEASDHRRLSVTLEALSWALKGGWGDLDREARLPLLMSAHAADSDNAVRDMFATHSAPRWDASTQKTNLSTWWASHSARQGGYTVATLFYTARRNGWLAYSSVELSNATEVYTEEVGDWLTSADLPSRTLLKSPTGTGKTQGAIRYLRHVGAKRVLFFAPSIKLCIALSRALDAAGVGNTLYIGDDRKTKDAATLRKADVLVTTLQTFATKVNAGGKADYDLVVIDEADDLISAFVRSGIGGKLTHGSHVTGQQARAGVDALAALLRDAKQVLMLDGTATDLSRYVLEALSPDGTTGVYVNTYTRQKAPVTFFGQLAALRHDLVTEVQMGRRVVVACDTRAEAALVETLLRVVDACPAEQILRITGDTVADGRVTEFFRDVEAGAAQYQVVIYNTAMGSGVSIIHTQPDVVYLFGQYLAPRRLLQLLNRYRRQRVVRAYVPPRETLYVDTVDERYTRMVEVAGKEAAAVGLATATRVPLAEVVSDAALIAAVDEHDQTRATRDFLTRLLREEGRTVDYLYTDTVALEVETKLARGLLRDRKAAIMASWRSVPALERGAALPAGITVDDTARALLHGIVRDAFGARVDADTGLDDAEVAELALRFGRHKWLIDRWVTPDKIMNSTADEQTNNRRETVTFKLYLSRVELLTLVAELIPDWGKTYRDDDLEARASAFVRGVFARRSVYDMVASGHQQYEEVAARGLSEVEMARTLAGAILKGVGLKLKRASGKRTAEGRERVTGVDGRRELMDYLRLRGYDLDPTALAGFNRPAFAAAADTARDAARRFTRMGESARREVLGMIQTFDRVTFADAVDVQAGTSFVN